MRAHAPAAALDELERLLATDAAHVMVAAIDWDRYLTTLPEGAGRPLGRTRPELDTARGRRGAAGAARAAAPSRRSAARAAERGASSPTSASRWSACSSWPRPTRSTPSGV